MQIEGFLEEMVLLCQRSEEYNQFVVAKLGAGAATAKTEAAARETAFRGGAFNMAVRELVSYYMALVSALDDGCARAGLLLHGPGERPRRWAPHASWSPTTWPW